MRRKVTLDLDAEAAAALAHLGRQHRLNFESTVQFLCCSAAAYRYAADGNAEAAVLLALHAQRRVEPLHD